MTRMWKLCLQADRKRQIVEVANDASVSDLYDIAASKFQSPVVVLKHGIPASVLDPTQTLVGAGIANQDRVIVEWTKDDVTADIAGNDKTKRRPQRAAAKQASETMPAMVAAQEAAMQPVPRVKNHSSRKRKNPPPSVNKHFASLETARRLKDGAQIMASPRKQRRKEQSTSIEEGLMNARKNWKEAVNSAYEQNRASARLAAPRSKIHFNPQDEKTLMVEFPKGIQGRGTFIDTVDWIPKDALQEAISSSNDPEEGLRPSNLALLSPRVFWALRYHFPADTLEESLRFCAPDRDWGFLRRRKLQLSEKARDNLRQQQEAEGSEEMSNWEAAAEAIAAVEDAMANSYAITVLRAPQRTTQSEPEWSIVTPEDEDEDELYECVLGGDGEERTDEARTIVQKLVQKVRNWRELANCSESDLIESFSTVDADSICGWIDYARLQTLEEIMVEICDGDVIAVERLREEANSGTPRDLVVWRPALTTLHGVLPEYSIEKLEKWCFHAHHALRQFPWLVEFVTPLD